MDSVFLDYQKLVMEYYQRNKRLDLLHSHLSHPTQAKLKKASLRLCLEKISGKDEKVIKDFCEEWDETKTCFENIKKYDVDKFKPIYNYLKGGSESPDPKYIQLLAWLIEFPIRPYDYTKDYTAITVDNLLKPQAENLGGEFSSTVANPIMNVEGVQGLKSTKSSVEEKENRTEDKGYAADMKMRSIMGDESKIKPRLRLKRRYRKAIIVGALIVFVAAGGYWWDKTLRYNMSFENGGCMYWAEDHYQPIPCNHKIPNSIVVALDSVKVRNFKKITQQDTITHRAIGIVWYSKIDKKIEFFTSDGCHPIVMGRRLKPITSYIIDKYINQGVTSSQ